MRVSRKHINKIQIKGFRRKLVEENAAKRNSLNSIATCEEGKYFVICPKCGVKKKISIMKTDELLTFGSISFHCSECRNYKYPYTITLK
jgi:hypothetical protein